MSEAAQVAYDRIMCEHMRNICISQQLLNFFTKRLTEDQRQELANVLTSTPEGFQITWVADSILKYSAFRESRSKNRQGKKKEQVNNTSYSSEKHMENENESVNEDENQDRGVGEGPPTTLPTPPVLIAPQMVSIFKTHFPEYPLDQSKDFSACLMIAQQIAAAHGWSRESVTNGKQAAITAEWTTLVLFAVKDSWYSSKSIKFISEHWQDFILASKKPKNGKNFAGASGTLQPGGQDATRINIEGFGQL